MRIITIAGVILAGALVSGCSTIGLSERISGVTDTTKAERCLGYQVDLTKYELAVDALDKMDEERQARIDKLRALVEIECAEVETASGGE